MAREFSLLSINYDLTTFEGLRQATFVAKSWEQSVSGLYCPRCQDHRRVLVTERLVTGSTHKATIDTDGLTVFVSELEAPSLITLTCVQCEGEFTAVVYEGVDGLDVVLLPSVRGGLGTTSCPEGVAYYLDQAARCESIGARTAAVTMYRAALEFLLHERGYMGMLDAKIRALTSAIGNGTAPEWAVHLDTSFLAVIKSLGNFAIHPNGGDISKQNEMDAGLLASVRTTFAELLELIYEAPARKQKRLDEMKAKVDNLT